MTIDVLLTCLIVAASAVYLGWRVRGALRAPGCSACPARFKSRS
jgi:hypothetical protein